jgi:hypothetical protein
MWLIFFARVSCKHFARFLILSTQEQCQRNTQYGWISLSPCQRQTTRYTIKEAHGKAVSIGEVDAT